MNIKTKTSLLIFTILFVILIPYSLLFLKSDFASSIIPGWHTTINSFNLIANILKLVLLFIVVIFYWKLSKIIKAMPFKYFILHLFLTIPSIIISKIPLIFFVNFDNQNLEKTINEIDNVNRIVIIINTLFIIGQILFGMYYYKTWKKRNIK
jgi:DNA integrity scanning protein DisA with diadenylate cyclase activity